METFGERMRAAARVIKWATLALAATACLVGAFGLTVRECNRPAPEPACADEVVLLNSGMEKIQCHPQSTMQITQVASGQLVRCACRR